MILTRANKHRLWPYVAAALLCHGLLAFALMTSNVTREQAGKPAAVVNTYFYPITSSNIHNRGNAKQTQTNTAQQTPLPNQGQQAITKASTTTKTIASQAASTQKHSLGHSQLLAILHNRIQQQQRYPQSALFNDESGTVTVKFKLKRNGHIIQTRLVKSSNFADLDQAALRAVNTSSAINPKLIATPQWFTVNIDFSDSA